MHEIKSPLAVFYINILWLWCIFTICMYDSYVWSEILGVKALMCSQGICFWLYGGMDDVQHAIT